MHPEIEPGTYPVHDFSPFLVQFTEVLGIRYYSLAYIFGFVIAGWLMYRASKTGRSPLPSAKVERFLFYMIGGVMLGGRLGSMLFYDLDTFLAKPWTFFFVWQGGMASHGGMIGVTVAVLLFAWKEKIPVLRLGDLVAMATPPGIFLGRLANFINGELWGKPTTVAWAWVFPDAPRDYTAPDFFEPLVGHVVNPRHPSQLYEAALEGLLLGVYVMWRYWGRKGPLPRAGQLVPEFFILYGLVRIFGEHFREPDAALVMGLSRGIFLSILLVIVGIAFLVWIRRHPPSNELNPAR